LLTFCLDWSQIMLFMISASWVAGLQVCDTTQMAYAVFWVFYIFADCCLLKMFIWAMAHTR
jgi:hypothetical protein